MKKLFLTSSALAVLSLASSFPNAALAQQATTAGTAKAANIEEIVVTARRTSENIQSVPVSVLAFSNKGLRERNISTPEDLQMITPGVSMVVADKQNVNITIRGQSKSLAGISSPAVLGYFAEVPNPNYGSFIPQFDMSSIQVLKGPQGTLFGRNTTGGAVLFTPQAPTADLNGFVEAGISTYKGRNIKGVINLPVNDKVRIRLGAFREVRDGFTRDLNHPDRRLDDMDDYTLRGSLWVEPVEGLTNLTIVDFYKSDTNGQGNQLFDVANGTTAAGGPTVPALFGVNGLLQAAFAQQRANGPFDISYSPLAANAHTFTSNVRRLGITNRTEWDMGDGFKLINIFGYRDAKLHYLTNAGVPVVAFPTTPPTPFDFLYAGLDNAQHQYSDEVQLHGKAFGDKLDWMIGAFYLRANPSGPQGQTVAFGEFPSLPPAFNPYGAAAAFVPELNGYYAGKASYAFVTEESKAAFAHITYDLGAALSGLQFEAGFRYTKDKVSECVGTGPTISHSDVGPGQCLTTLTGAAILSSRSKAPTWSVGLNWQATDNIFGYVVTRRGYRSGGVNSPIFAGRLVPLQSFSPEKVTDVELGVRTTTDISEDVKLRVNVSGFIGWYNNVQTQVTGVQQGGGCVPGADNQPPFSPDGDCNPNNDPSGGTLLANLGKSRVSGVDLDGALQITRAFNFYFAANFLNPTTVKYTAPAALAPYVGATPHIPFNFTADRTLSLGARYILPLPEAWGEVVLNGDWYSTTRIRYGETFIPAYDVFNARVDWNGIAGSNIDFSVYARNLFNNKYLSAINATGDFLGLTTGPYGPPRIIGAQVRYQF